MTARTTGRIFNILVDNRIERVKGGKIDRCSVRICRYVNDDPRDHDWTSNGYPTNSRPVTAATRSRLTKVAALALENRKAYQL